MKLISVKDANGQDYKKDDWRLECINGQGIVIFEELVRKFITFESLRFCYIKGEKIIEDNLDELQTSYGSIIEEDSEKIVFKTRKSIYTFEFANTLSDDAKDAMLRFGKEEK